MSLQDEVDSPAKLEAEMEIYQYILPSYSESNVIVLTGITPSTKHVLISIMVLKKSIRWANQQIKTNIVIFWDYGMSSSYASLYEFGYLPNFLNFFAKQDDVIQALMHHESCDRINELIRKYQSSAVFE